MISIRYLSAASAASAITLESFEKERIKKGREAIVKSVVKSIPEAIVKAISKSVAEAVAKAVFESVAEPAKVIAIRKILKRIEPAIKTHIDKNLSVCNLKELFHR